MSKKSLPLLVLALTLLNNPNLYAETLKTFNLKDGSIIKGEVLELNQGVYTVKTELGQVSIPDEDILSMSSNEAQANNPASPQPSTSATNSAIKGQVEQLQGSIMADPEMTAEIQKMMQDPEIMSILSDPKFMNDVLTYDPNRIEANQNTQQLLQKPAIQNLINKINQKFPQAQSKP